MPVGESELRYGRSDAPFGAWSDGVCSLVPRVLAAFSLLRPLMSACVSDAGWIPTKARQLFLPR